MAPLIFQAVMDQGQKNTVCYLDDILITGKNAEENMEALEGAQVSAGAWHEN